jgi:pimeloyl-ACP methyl ester carboxylesterase
MPTALLNGLTFEYSDEGPPDGAACLLLHGFPQDRTSWDTIAARLVSLGYRVVRPDQRGYSPGARPRSADDYRLEPIVSDAVALLDELEVSTAHVVGHDWGGAVAWGLATQHPDRVRTLTVLSTPHPVAMSRSFVTSTQGLRSWYMGLFQVPGLAERLLAPNGRLWSAMMRGLPAQQREHYTRRAAEPGALAAMLSWYRAMPLDMVRPSIRWRRVTVPTLHLWGTRDPALGEAATRLTARSVAGEYTLVELVGEGHWLPELASDKVLDALVPHLDAR